MIAALRGILSEKLETSLVLEVGGVGYELFVTVDDWGSAQLGTEGYYYIYEQIREDAHNLYGFTALGPRQLFVQLLSVSGVGPKLALQILSAAGEARLRQAIAAGDPALLKGITGVGPKTAQRLIVDLRGKVEQGTAGLAPVADPTYQGLVSLGYTSAQAAAAVAALPADLKDDQARLKAALKTAGKS
ncbi:MAG TPA: Holliday junction branch migration protein RuvA [Candidatus Saccharimonadia bacterium]|jgi:Holliday junction DNA helicase RuvA|nr:Holliday junction branch migration protein RuvA [Candidatus Saccharimonadia bacterium]